MSFQEMKIKGAWIHTPSRHRDNRGFFEEKFKLSQIESVIGRTFFVKQVNESVSNRGVIRGIHFTDESAGQAKYVSCPRGAIWDVVVDLRKDSKTYGAWDAVELTAENGLSVLISEGLGHAFLSLQDGSVANYLCSSEYDPEVEQSIYPFSEKLAIPFASRGVSNFVLSEKDSKATSF